MITTDKEETEYRRRLDKATTEEERNILRYLHDIKDTIPIRRFKFSWAMDLYGKPRPKVNGFIIESIFDLDAVVKSL